MRLVKENHIQYSILFSSPFLNFATHKFIPLLDKDKVGCAVMGDFQMDQCHLIVSLMS